MARVTVEDCLGRVDNRFQLVLVAAKRARQLARGTEPFVEWENDKPTVVALREIAEDYVTAAILDEKPEELLSVEDVLIMPGAAEPMVPPTTAESGGS